MRWCIVAWVLSAALCVGQQPKSGEKSVQTPSADNSTSSTPPAETLSPEAFAKLANKVRHELVMLPYYDVYDNLYFRIDGRTVTLLGQTPNPSTKSTAETP